MARLVLRRFAHAMVLLALVLVTGFLLLQLAPGDAVTRYLDPSVDPETAELIRVRLGLDQPAPVRLAKWLAAFVRGEWGVSLAQQRPVAQVIGEALPRTLQLTAPAMFLQILLGLLVGVFAAGRVGSWFDRTTSISALALYALPSFFIADVCIELFAQRLGWFPVAGIGQSALSSRAWHASLPVVVLTMSSVAVLIRFTRTSVLQQLRSRFATTAHAKGLSRARVLWTHAFPAALTPVLTMIGLAVPALITGSVVIETIFAWPGMGKLLVDAMFARDYPVVMAVVLLSASAVIAANLLADLGQLWADPPQRDREARP